MIFGAIKLRWNTWIPTFMLIEAAATIINLRTFENFSDVYVDSITEYSDEEAGLHGVSFNVTCTYGENPMFAVEEATEEVAE